MPARLAITDGPSRPSRANASIVRSQQNRRAGFNSRQSSSSRNPVRPEQYTGRQGGVRQPSKGATRAEENENLYQLVLKDPMGSHPAPHLPDDFSGTSLPLKLHLTTSFKTSPSLPTFGTTMITPELDSFIWEGSDISTPISTSWIPRASGATHPDYSGPAGLDLIDSAFRYRAICMATEVMYTGPADQLGGTLRYAFSADRNGVPPGTVSWGDLTSNAGELMIKAGKPITLVSRLYQQPVFDSVFGSSAVSTCMNSIAMCVDGVDPANFRIKTVYYIEILPNLAGPLESLARDAPTGSTIRHTNGPAGVFYSTNK